MKISVVIFLCLALAIPPIPWVRGAPYSMECEVIISKVIDIDTFELKIKNYEEINREKKLNTTSPGCALKKIETLRLNAHVLENNGILREKVTEDLRRAYEGREAIAVINYIYKPEYEGYTVIRDEDGALTGSLVVDDGSIAEELRDIESIIEGLRELKGITKILRELTKILREIRSNLEDLRDLVKEVMEYLYKIKKENL
jgi:hypothetical protein